MEYRHIPQTVKDAIESRIQYHGLEDEEKRQRYRAHWMDKYRKRRGEYYWQHVQFEREPLNRRLDWLDMHMPEDEEPVSIDRVIINEVLDRHDEIVSEFQEKR